GAPIVFHGVLGIRYALTGKFNFGASDGSSPSLRYSRNRAYTWQRLTSWILLIGIIAHVSYMRFYIYPLQAKEGGVLYYFVRLQMDKGLYTVADRLGVKLYDQNKIQEQVKALDVLRSKMQLVEQKQAALEQDPNAGFLYDQEAASIYDSIQRYKERKEWVKTLKKRAIGKDEVIGVSKDFGSVTLLSVRDAFKSPFKSALYTI